MTAASGAPDVRPRAPGERRVLVLCDAYWSPNGGTEGQLRHLLARLPAPWRAELFILHESQWLREHPFPCPSRSLEVGPLARLGRWLDVRRLAKEVRAGGFDLIHTYMGDSSVLGPLIGARAGVPVLVSRRDLGFWHTPRVLQALRRTGRLAAGYLANGDAVKRHVVDVEHAPPDDVAVVRNGQDLAAFDPPRDPTARARLGIPEHARLVGLLANFKPLKRQPDLVEAVALLAQKHPDLHVLYLGEGATAPTLERAHALGIADRVHLHHATGGSAALVKELEIGVLCSETEGLSNAILEYMGCSRPVVATDVGGNPELVVDGETGRLYPVGDVEALARALATLLADPAAAAGMGAAGRRRVEVEFGMQRMVDETLAIYERALAGRPVGRGDPAPAGTAIPSGKVGGAGGGSPTAASAPPETRDAAPPPAAPRLPAPAGPRPASALRTEIVEDLATLEALAPAWSALLGRDRFFVGPDWVLLRFRHAAAGTRPFAVVARDADGALVGLLPLARRGRQVTVCGARAGADHVDVVARPDAAPAVADAVLDALVASRLRVHLEHLSDDGALRYAIRARRWRGLPYGEVAATVAPYVEAKRTFDAYLGKFRAKQRGNLRRQARAFRADPTATIRRVTDPAEVPAGIDALFALHAKRFEGREGRTSFAGEEVRRFHRELATVLCRRGDLALTFLTVDGRDVAVHYGWRFGGKLWHFQGGFDPAAASRSPGTALMTMVLEDDVFGAGLTEYDFLDGDETYKTTFATGRRRLFDVRLGRPGRLGRARLLLRGAAKLAKVAVAARFRRDPASHPDPDGPVGPAGGEGDTKA